VKNFYLYNSVGETAEYFLDDWFEGYNLTYNATDGTISDSV
jgi:hypothetical protein